MSISLALLRRFWPAIPMLLLAGALLLTRAKLADVRHTLDNERAAWTAEVDKADRAKLTAERDYAARHLAATNSFADRLSAIAPIIIRSTDTVRTYAQTDAGRARCLAPDRVRGIDALDAGLADDTRSAGRGSVALPPDANAAPAGW